MSGNRLVNGAGVSRRRRGQSTVSKELADTDGRNANATSWQPFVGQQHNGDCRFGVHGSIPTASAYGHLPEAALTWERVTLTNLRRQQNRPTADLEYMLQEPGVVGSNPTGATCDT